ncbi:MAG TPA: BadF/BadG/BcrA/BcrD ATPase family protein [Terriglobales bacterium]|nr:BadF/BadG/BcrA/BcrD ATPase family protein [Terriglobales bacterium]
MAIYLGIDGGGTKTTCVLADERGIVGTATCSGSNITRLGEARVREALHAAVREACAAAKVKPSQIASACIGLSGAGRPEVRDVIAGIMREVLEGRIDVVSDLETTLEAAFGGGPGVIVIAGTGSIAYGRDAHRRTARAGGWGLAISDEGSGQWIGRAAVSAVLNANDAGENPPLLQTILSLWKLTSLDELVRYANASPPPDFSSLVPTILFAAESPENPRPSRAWTGHPRDPVAESVLRRAGSELAALARNVIRRLFGSEVSVPVAMTGGVFRQSERVRQVFYNGVIAEFPRASVHPVVVDPVEGALALARKALAGPSQ